MHHFHNFNFGVCFRGTASSVHLWAQKTPDSNGVATQNFGLGDKVYIFFNDIRPTGATVDVIVYDANHNPVFSQSNCIDSDSPLEWEPTSPGYYYIWANGQLAWGPVTIGSIFVAPESILGSLMLMTAGFAAFGVFGFVKYRRAKSKKL